MHSITANHNPTTNMEEHIQINGAYNLVICTKCKRALTPGNGAIDHLRKKHQVSGTILKDIDNYLCLGQARNPKTIELPTNWGPRQPVIPVESGFKCRACPFITISEKIANTHWRGATHKLQGSRYTRVNVQSWMSGKYSRYWTVGSQGCDQSTDTDAQDAAGIERGPSMLEQIVRRGAKRQHEANEQWRRAGQAQQGADYDNEFVKDMRWVEFSDGRDRAVISAATLWINAKTIDGLSQGAAEEDVEVREELVMLCNSIKREVKRCSPRLNDVPKPIRQRLHGIEAGKSNPIPFRMGSDVGTLQKYSIICQRYICFCWRAFVLGREEARNKLCMRFTDEQWGLLCDIKRVIQETERNGSDGDESTDGYDSDVDAFRQSSHPEPRHISNHEELDRVLFRFLIASIKTKVGGAIYTNALLCFLAATAIRPGGDGFRPAGLFTATVAAMLWMLRLFFLEDSFSDMPLNVDDITAEKMEWFSEEHAKWLSVDQFTVVGTMINWMAYGKGHRNKTMATPTVRWTDDYETLVHNGEHIRVHEFQRAAYRIKLKADQVMQTLFGGQWSTIGPNIDLRSILPRVVTHPFCIKTTYPCLALAIEKK